MSALNLATEVHTSGNMAIRSHLRQAAELIFISRQLSDMDGLSLADRLTTVHGVCPDRIVLLGDMSGSVSGQASATRHYRHVFDSAESQEVDDFVRDFVQQYRLEHNEGNLLLVDANRQRRLQLSERLNTFGYQTHEADNLVDALRVMRIHVIDLIISASESGSGFHCLDLIQTVRSKQSHHLEMPILVMTDNSSDADCLELLNSGANDYLRHSAGTTELIARIGNLVKTRQLYEQVKYQRARLMDLAMTDQLTRVYNRHYLFEVAPQKVSEARRHHFDLSLIILDLDHFKLINDRFGHGTGDTVLHSVGKLLLDLTRKEDVVGRFGGEEFVILLTHCDLSYAFAKAGKIAEHIRALKPDGVDLTASFGVAALDPATDTSFSDLFNRADKAVYQAKDAGRDRVEIAHAPSVLSR
ncbi:MAG: diguanylate cyclase [Pseudomonadales bacterium]|nr:diguanylate cyclase [Pseudomonadales bacterium]